jgi:transposase
MMGTKARIFAPIAVVSLENLVPSNHFYRHLDHVLDLSFVRDLVKETYAHGGRPSIDPVVFWHRCNSCCFLKTSARSGYSCSWWQIN